MYLLVLLVVGALVGALLSVLIWPIGWGLLAGLFLGSLWYLIYVVERIASRLGAWDESDPEETDPVVPPAPQRRGRAKPARLGAYRLRERVRLTRVDEE